MNKCFELLLSQIHANKLKCPKINFHRSTIQWHTVWQHMLWTNLNFRNEKIGSFHNILQPNLYIRIFPDGMILYSIRSEYYSTNPHNIQDGGVWMLTIYYGTSMIHLNSSWKQFMSTEGLLKYFPLLSVSENQFFPRNTYFHIYFPLWHFQVRSRPESWYSDSVFSWQSKQTLTFNILFLGNLVRSIPSNCLNSPFMNFGGEGLWCNFVDTLPWPCSRKTALYIACFVSYL